VVTMISVLTIIFVADMLIDVLKIPYLPGDAARAIPTRRVAIVLITLLLDIGHPDVDGGSLGLMRGVPTVRDFVGALLFSVYLPKIRHQDAAIWAFAGVNGDRCVGTDSGPGCWPA
jgi:hypothetical protein